MWQAFIFGTVIELVSIVLLFERAPSWQLVGYGLAVGCGALITSWLAPHHRLGLGILTSLPTVTYFLIVSAIYLPPLSLTHVAGSLLLFGAAVIGSGCGALLPKSPARIVR